MASGSRFEELRRAKELKIQALGANVEDVIKQKQLEAELARIDDETKQQIEEIKNEPVNTELITAQAKALLDSKKKSNNRNKLDTITEYENVLKGYRDAVAKAETALANIKESAAEEEERRNLQAQQEYERTVASAGNVEQTIQLRIGRVKQDAEIRKRDIAIRLSNITIRNDAQTAQQKEIDNLYNDIKEISIKVGDIKK